MAIIRGLPKQVAPRGGVAAGVRVLGVPEALAKLRGVDSVVRLNLGQMTAGAAAHMAALAREYVPVITGNLQSSITVTKAGVAYSYIVSASSLEGNIPEKNSKEYAGYVEFGRKGMAPRYFMTRAWRDTYPLAVAELKMLAAKIQRL